MTKLFRLCEWIGRMTGTIILTPYVWAVGNRAEEIYFGFLKARREGKKLVILLPFELPGRLRWRLTNMEVANVESPYRAFPGGSPLDVIGRFLITAYFASFRAFGFALRRLAGRRLNVLTQVPAVGTFTLWQPEERMREFSWDVVDRYDWREQLETPLPVAISQRKKLKAKSCLAKMGLPADAWFVCLHVREGGYLNDQCAERNADISNYIGAIEEVTSRGGWVVRMGDATMKKLPVMEHVIDYPFTAAKSALMDVYLISECRAYIGMSSGIYEVAILFRRPIILTNMWSWLFPFAQKKGDISLLKHVYSKSRGRFLSLRDWLAEPFAAHFFHAVGDDYVFHENDHGELRSAVREFFDRGEAWEATALQREFNELRFRNGRRLLSQNEPIVNADVFTDVRQRYRLASRLDSSVGVLSADFVRQNWDRDVRNLVPVPELAVSSA